MLGEENAGKSSFISRSDQRFALTRIERSVLQRSSADPDLAFGIDWWIGDDAVVIDPPGEFISQPERQVQLIEAVQPLSASEDEGDGEAEEATAQVGKPAEATGLPAGVERRLWRHMIGWLAQNRSWRPLNGVVLLVDMVALKRSVVTLHSCCVRA